MSATPKQKFTFTKTKKFTDVIGADGQVTQKQDCEVQKVLTEIEEMTLLDETKSYRVVVEGSRNNSTAG